MQPLLLQIATAGQRRQDVETRLGAAAGIDTADRWGTHADGPSDEDGTRSFVIAGC